MKNNLKINDLFVLTVKNHWDSERYATSGWLREVNRIYKSNLQDEFGDMKIQNLTAKRIRNWHKKLIDTPIAANRALNVLSKMFSYAVEQEFIPQNTNPCAIVKLHRERKRKRFATHEELKNIAWILEREATKNPRAVAFIYLLLYSGARPRSIERAKWSDITLLNHEGEIFGVLTFKGKSSETTGEDEQVTIPPQGMKLLNTLSKKTKTITGIKMPKDFWNRVRIEAGCPDLWARDLRRTFATIGLSSGESVGVIGELLNHKSASTTKIYTQLIQTKKIEVTKNIALNISNIIKVGAK